MAVSTVPINKFISLATENRFPVFDARSESEFNHAHFPGALNLPLLVDEHRAIVGTIYKQKGHEEAVINGFELAGPRFHQIIRNAREASPEGKVLVYCWRGGMRSKIISWLLDQAGFEIYLLEGGYKSFRRWTAAVFEKQRNVIVLGGPTGSGKTTILNEMAMLGEQVIDLEALANHKGSAFGALGKGEQPTNEHFENLLSLQWEKKDPSSWLWLENESRTIGSCSLPARVFNAIRSAPVMDVRIGMERRRKRILDEYAIFPIEILKATTTKIGKRLGPQHLKKALEALDGNDFDTWLTIVIHYYDKLYAHGSSLRDPHSVFQVDLEHTVDEHLASAVQQFAQRNEVKQRIQTAAT